MCLLPLAVAGPHAWAVAALCSQALTNPWLAWRLLSLLVSRPLLCCGVALGGTVALRVTYKFFWTDEGLEAEEEEEG